MPADLRRALPALLLGVAGCTGDPGPDRRAVSRAPTVEGAAPREVAPAPDDALRGAMAALAATAVRGDAPVRKVLYTWTTRAQSEALRAEHRLLTREATAAGERSRFDVALERESGPVAALLREPGRRARRFAWPLPWATAQGFDGGGYGPDLVRVELRPQAIVVVFSPGAPWRFLDMEGREIAEAEVLAAPDRLAAVYHVAPADGDRPAYREYVLVGEAMIASWAIGTDEVRAAIRDDAALLAVIADKIDALRPLAAARCEAEGATACPAAEMPEETGETAAWSARLAAGPWRTGPPTDALLADLYASCLALPGPAYVPTGGHLRAIAERLRALEDQPPPLMVTPDAAAPPPLPAGGAAAAKARAKERVQSRCDSDPSLVGCTRPLGTRR